MILWYFNKIFDKKAPEFLTRLTPTCSEVYHAKCKKNAQFICTNPIHDGHFRGCKRIGVGAKKPPSLKFVTHILQCWNLAVIPYLKKIQKIYESPDRPSDFCWNQHLEVYNTFRHLMKCENQAPKKPMLRLALSHRRKYKFKISFHHILNALIAVDTMQKLHRIFFFLLFLGHFLLDDVLSSILWIKLIVQY